MWCGPLGRPPTPSFGLYIAFDLKTHGEKSCKASNAATSRNSVSGAGSGTPDGELEEIIAIITTDASINQCLDLCDNSEKSGHQPGPTGPATGQSGVLAGQPGGNRAPKEEPADPVCARSTGLLTGGSGAPSGRPGGNRAATGHQPEKHQDDAKELRSLIRSDRPLDRAVRSVARSTGCSVELWEIIVHGYREPQDPIRLTSTEFYNRQLNASARDKIRSGINRKLLDQVNDIESAKELWDRIVVLQEGTDLIQSALYETAKQEAHQFMIREGESVADAYARLGALRVRVKGLGVEKYNDGFEMNEAFIKSKVIAMIAVKQEDTNLALNLQIMTKSADLNSDDLVSYVAANENMAKAGKRLMAMNRVDEASHNHEAPRNLALKARADHGEEEEYEFEEEEEMTSTSDIATDFAFFAKKYKGKFQCSSMTRRRRELATIVMKIATLQMSALMRKG
ncbi:hypothetical protein QYE76_034680 [Lolium multiflorum]|uniref:Uncharacterized protein n=1 Tax=Lolium multiflorum TaxID=4521 RepID=A0AAD8QZK4_LOLMU|nr:hypothetical protein QYE76_034680 [Lolium multiflorum]